MTLNRRLFRFLRKRNFLTLRKLEEKVWIDKDTLNKVEKWAVQPQVKTLEKLAKFYGKKKEEFYIFEDKPLQEGLFTN